VEAIEEINKEKSKLVYQVIDDSQGFYINSIHRNARSRINIIFNCRGGPSIEDQFALEAEKSYGIKQIKGHRLVSTLKTISALFFSG
jgi:phosphoserine aminotransferase